MNELFKIPPSALAYAKEQQRLRIRGHAAKPGTGPAGETCKTCTHRNIVMGGKRPFSKCGLMRALWTGGPASDIRACDPACSKWAHKDA